ncbi:MAG: DUF3073 domain-containing protein [Actinomycetota bacterium]|nr:DUF3073 domain-containing protein [Actinomycetota bacterium]
MGRGRAKAKQTKVARALKYGGPQTDFDRLQAELAGGEVTAAYVAEIAVEEVEVEDDEDPYAKYYEEDDEDDEEDEDQR